MFIVSCASRLVVWKICESTMVLVHDSSSSFMKHIAVHDLDITHYSGTLFVIELLLCVVQGDGTRWRHTVCSTTAAECCEFSTQHVQLGCSPAELHGNTITLL